MKSPQPSKVAAWILQHFGCGTSNDAVLGDLVERRSQGKSPFWYWRQVVIAISASLVRQAKDHPLPILRGVAAGWAVNTVWQLMGSPLFRENTYPTWIVSTGHGTFLAVALLIIVLCVHAATGWIVSRTSAEYRKTAVIGYSTTVLMYGVVRFGWQWFFEWHHPGRILSYLNQLFLMGGVLLALGILVLIATLFGGGLLTGSPRISPSQK